MRYNKFGTKNISALGFGMMRLPIIGEDMKNIDMDALAEMVDCAYESGVNYFDTAWGYHNGMSEIATGKVLGKYPRDSFYLASKFPGYDVSNFGKAEEIFEEQLKKCGVEYFDFYLLHCLSEGNVDYYLDDEKYGTISYLLKQKETGRIKHLGFSAHASVETMTRFLENIGFTPDFCQLQLNYIDITFQQGREKIDLLTKHGIPVWVMEPVRGGMLANLPENEAVLLKAYRPDDSLASWAFRYIETLPEVVVTLSGMSTLEQVKDNIATFSTEKPLTEEELSTLLKLAEEKIKKAHLPCTACKYCTEACPMELDIPYLISLYNRHGFREGPVSSDALAELPEDKRPSACLGCRACEALCPQGIKISEAMAKFKTI